MLSEFKDFIAKGNVMDMAVGIIIGAAFTAIVTSLVGDLINPIIGLASGGVDFTNNYAVLGGEVPAGASLEVAREAGASGHVKAGAFENGCKYTKYGTNTRCSIYYCSEGRDLLASEWGFSCGYR